MSFWDSILSRKPTPVAVMQPQVVSFGSISDVVDDLVWATEFHDDPRNYSVPFLWRTQPHLRTVITFIARNLAQLKIPSYSVDADGDHKMTRQSPFAQIMRMPNPTMTRYRLIFSLFGDKMLYDRAHWLVAPTVDRDLPYIYRLPPSRVAPVAWDNFGVTQWAFTSPDGGSVPLPAGSLVTFPGYHPTHYTQASPAIEVLRDVLAEQHEAAKYRKQIWKRGGRVSAVLQRPKDAPDWSDTARTQFADDWYAQYTGDGSRAGGTPILEDGMTLNRIDFSAQEQQFVDVAKLALATVAGAFHINPTMVGQMDGATYSNVREFRRMLYGDSLGPDLVDVAEVMNVKLLPLIGMDPMTEIVEFNLRDKLEGTFEEQATAVASLTGRPVMTADEGRAHLRLPALGGDAGRLVTPLNVLVGGQASPNDTGSQNVDPNAPGHDSEPKAAPKASRPLLKAAPSQPQRDKIAEVLAGFFDRQGKSVLSQLGGDADWWDESRWNSELKDDLTRVAHTIAADLGAKAAEAAGFPDTFDPDATVHFLQAVAERYASNINATTKAQLDTATSDPEGDPAQVFKQASGSRATGIATGIGTFLGGFATTDAARQIALSHDVKPTKTWVTGDNPRPDHAAVDGETVPIDESFSNGLDWPGSGGDVDQVAGCNCSVEVSF